MKKMLLLILAILVAPLIAQAYIIDTGAPDESELWSIGVGEFGQSLASQFTLTNAYTLSSFEGYFFDAPSHATSGSLTMAIYSGSAFDNNLNGPIPDIATQIFSTTFQINNVNHQDNLFGGWHGAFGLNQILNPGTYWIAFEGREGNTYEGVMPGVSPNFLTTAAWAHPDYNGGAYNFYDSLANGGPMGLGIRFNGPVTPEPVSFLLYSLGAVVLSKRARRAVCGSKKA